MTNKEIIAQLYQSFASGDGASVIAGFSDDIEWTEADGFPLTGTYTGPQAILEGVLMRLCDFGDKCNRLTRPQNRYRDSNSDWEPPDPFSKRK